MGVQLVVYPQGNPSGEYSYVSIPTTNKVADGNFMSVSIPSSQVCITADPAFEAVDTGTQPTTALWQPFHTNGSAFFSDTTGAVQGYNKITLKSSSSGDSSCGVHQLISNLVIGANYTLYIDVETASPTGTLYLSNGHTGGGSTSTISWIPSPGSLPTVQITHMINFGASSIALANGTISISFTAQANDEILVIDYVNSNGDDLDIARVQIKQSGNSPSLIYGNFYDGQVILDLYEDESIPLTLSVDEFTNIALKRQSYSKDFNLPATKRNNRIFSHIFEITRTAKDDAFAFNPHIKTKAIVKEDSYTIFDGFLRMINIIDKDGEISYNVNLYSDSVSLSDILKERTLGNLNLGELKHEYQKTNIVNSWDDSVGLALVNNLSIESDAYDSAIGVGNTNVLKYPFVDWTGNIEADDGSGVQLPTLEHAFRPFISCKYLIDMIFKNAGFTYTSTFLNSSTFTNLFVDYNWGSLMNGGVFQASETVDQNATSGSYSTITMGTLVPQGVGASYWNGSRLTATENNQTVEFNYSIKFKNPTALSNLTIEVKWVHKDSTGALLANINYQSKSIGNIINTTWTYTGTKTIQMNAGDTLEAQMEGNISLKTTSALVNFSITGDTIDNSNLQRSKTTELTQWDYFNGFVKMFNLIITQDSTQASNLVIEPYVDLFINNTDSVQLDWTNKVDISQVKLQPITDLKKIVNFTHTEDSKDYCANLYDNTSSLNDRYGDFLLDHMGLSLLQGEQKVESTPFAATIIKPLFSGYDSEFVTPAIFSGNDAGTEFEGFENKPRILYNNGIVTLAVGKYDSPIQNGTSQFSNETQFLQFTHFSELPATSTTSDYHFKTQQLFSNSMGIVPIDNLYNTYWSPYFDELYNPDTRIMTIKVNLSPADINTFRFYDKVLIKNREFRVNKIDYKPNHLSSVEFILIP